MRSSAAGSSTPRSELAAWPRGATFALSLILAGCSRGEGEGEVVGVVEDPACSLAAAAYDMGPTFFAADAIDDTIEIRIQHGSYNPLGSDGLTVVVTSASDVKASLLGTPLDFEPTVPHVPPTTPVSMTLRLNDTCELETGRQATVLVAESGSITFDALWVPDTDGDREISAAFTGVHLVDPSDPTVRFADIDGYFTFRYARGRPAQTFP